MSLHLTYNVKEPADNKPDNRSIPLSLAKDRCPSMWRPTKPRLSRCAPSVNSPLGACRGAVKHFLQFYVVTTATPRKTAKFSQRFCLRSVMKRESRLLDVVTHRRGIGFDPVDPVFDEISD